MASTIQVFVPVGVVATAVTRDSTASRLNQSDFIVGMLDNHKHGTEQILDRLQQRLTEQFGEVRFVRRKKGDAGRGAGQKIIDELAKQCGVVVNGVAD